MHDTINRLRAKKGDEGFTLIELLVVVVIIGVLVAIAVPVYLNYRKGAADKSAQSDVRGAVSAIEQYYTDNSNTYPDPTTEIKSTDHSFNLKDGSDGQVEDGGWVTLSDKSKMTYVPSGDSLSYTVCATNSGGSGKVYVYNSADGGSVTAVPDASMDTCD
ncbi:prepilin-type N-terminal cleavage/methylation domain-containing protein [Paractinoplanes rhizophilus]|uniref:Prepilin-type N-terminal cleavage/methylation domain-containing protein n=1 Tax=Paractinoplanes rhizophilus TaxID=1416877 RepID=A0ABW2I3E4_9ACTN